MRKIMDKQTAKTYDKIVSLLERLKEEKKNFLNLKIEEPDAKEAIEQDLNNHSNLPVGHLLKLAFNNKFTLDERQVKEICNGTEDEVAAMLFGGDVAIDLLKQRFQKLSISELQRFLNEILPKFISDYKILIFKDKNSLNDSMGAEDEKTQHRIKQIAESEINVKTDQKKRRVEAYNQNIRGNYWAKNIQPLINKIDIEVVPLRYSVEFYSSYVLGHTTALWEALESNRPEDLDPIIHEFRKLKKIVEVLPSKKQAETEQNVPINVRIENVQAKNLQIGTNASVYEQTVIGEKKKGIIRKLLGIIGAIVAFFAAVLTILHLLGWLEAIKSIWSK